MPKTEIDANFRELYTNAADKAHEIERLALLIRFKLERGEDCDVLRQLVRDRINQLRDMVPEL